MNKKIEILEIRRQSVHLVLGVILASLLYVGYISKLFLLGLLLISIIASWLSKTRKLPIYDHFLDVFERDHDRQKIPGRGLIFFLLGSFLAVVFFSLEIAVASILILAFGDSVSHVFGRHFGQIKTPFHPKKFLEGSLFGIILSAIAAGFFVPLAEALVASTVAMILEFPTIRISGHRLDDNLLIPLSAGVVLTIFQEFFPLG